MSANFRDNIVTSCELLDQCITFSDMHFFIVFYYLACYEPYGAISIVFHLVDPVWSSWLVCQLPGFPEVDSIECVIEPDWCVFILPLLISSGLLVGSPWPVHMWLAHGWWIFILTCFNILDMFRLFWQLKNFCFVCMLAVIMSIPFPVENVITLWFY